MQNEDGSGWLHLAAQFIEHFLASLWALLQALPLAPSAHARALGAILATGNRPLALALLLMALSLAAIFAPGALVRARPFTCGFLRGTSWQTLVARLLNDAVAIGGAMLIATLIVAVALTLDTAFEKLCVAIVMVALRWRVSFFGVTALLRRAQEAQPPLVEDDGALQSAKRYLGLAFVMTLGFVSVIPVMLSNSGPPEAQLDLEPSRGVAVVYSVLVCTLGILGVLALARAAPRRRIVILSGGLFLTLTLWAVWVYSVVQLDFGFYDAFTGLVTLLWVLALVDTLVRVPQSGEPAVTAENGSKTPPPAALVIPAARFWMLALTAAVGLTYIDRLWISDTLGLISAERWPAVASSINIALVIAVIGYLVYEILRAWAGVTFGPPRAAAVPGQGDEDEDMAAGSRLATIVPLLSRFLLFAALLAAVLAGLSNSGVNIGPLLAGAGIFGLAISFGSQALVRDIVSGLFYIFDDAFRVGEYVDTGKNKGTVERIALRSLRLRHQNGQIHTVPYGQLGAVTNFSRDWATIKFNFRLARDSDLEKVRKTTKKLGLLILEDGDIGKEFLSQLKMQGVADVLDTALLVRFKFTCLPTRSSLCQREVVKRLYKTLVENGVQFATNSVTVNMEGGAAEPASAQEKRVIAEAVAAAQRTAEDQEIKAEILAGG